MRTPTTLWQRSAESIRRYDKKKENMKPSTQDRTEGKLHEVKGENQGGGRKGDERPRFGSLRERGKESWQSSKMDRPR